MVLSASVRYLTAESKDSMKEKVVYRSLFTAWCNILVGSRDGQKILSPCIRCDVADGIDVAQDA